MSSKLTQSRPSNIELFKTEQYYIFVKNEYSLWWNRTTGELTPKTGTLKFLFVLSCKFLRFSQGIDPF